MKRLLLIGALIGAFLAPAIAQPVPQIGVTFGYLPGQTYSAAFFGLVPPASATDTVCIAGSASKTVAVQQIKLSGSAGTLVTLPVTLVRRASVATGGTAASTTANPANTIAKRDTTAAAATAVPIAYTAVPTITDASPTYLDSASLTLPVTSAGTVTVPLIFDYSVGNSNLLQPVILRGIAQQVCLNLNTVSVSSGVLNGVITWTEY
jgi:hypothetical protein